MEKFNIETYLVRGASLGDERTGAISYPIYQSATFKHPGLYKSTGYEYSRAQNPTREELEKTIAILEKGCGSLAFSSGVAAITACINLFKANDHFIISEDLYGGTFRLFNDTFKGFNIQSTFLDTCDINLIKKNIKENTKAIFIETPSNPLMRVADIRKISEICKEKGILLIVDNTFLTPYFQNPLELGADIVVHSGTKFIGGHNDVLAGFIIVKDEKLEEALRMIQMSTGAILSPMDSWLLLRSLKTLHIRVLKAQENALEIAKWLQNNENVEKVYYVGLESHKGYGINKSQSRGFGSMISFKVDKGLVPKILEELKVISFAESLGGTESLITYPFTQTHTDIPEDIKNRVGVDESLLRLSIGIEDINDLINDLKRVL
ncbi:MAG: trans-sulfuration enzyme family protein [Clostridium sp.]|uniref:trans-sulfuration enzyme family protein n=1 Tax=Clostridium sp. TaxID=1506 RepID=UPI003F30F348